MMNKEKQYCESFLIQNGWTLSEHEPDGCLAFYKDDDFGIEICETEIVFVSDWGDFLHLPINRYALIGALLVYNQISANFKRI